MRFAIITIALWWIAVILDHWSTVILSWRSEENPVVKYIWKEYGDLGFTVFNLLFAAIFSLIIYQSRKLYLFKVVFSAALILISFKIVIALTNFGLIPYAFTAWFSY